jgi:hypothetical protein
MIHWLYYANHYFDSLLHFGKSRRKALSTIVSSNLPPCNGSFEFQQDVFEIVCVTYDGDDDENDIAFPAGAEVFVNYNMSIPNFKCCCGSKKCMSLRVTSVHTIHDIFC